jgi:hypothetical protein
MSESFWCSAYQQQVSGELCDLRLSTIGIDHPYRQEERERCRKKCPMGRKPVRARTKGATLSQNSP